MKELLEEYVLENKALKEQLGMLVALAGLLNEAQDEPSIATPMEALQPFANTQISVENGEIHIG